MLNKIEEQQASTDDRAVVNRLVINVAVAVIHHQEQYLLGFRDSSQHQGDCYEFVGGKIDSHETPVVALMREVAEETGINIQDNHLVKLGRLHHDYGDKQVCLHVYKVGLTAVQYKQHQYCDYGLEGQALIWVPKSQLLAGDYPLPAANQTILAWLQLPKHIIITYPLIHFSDHTDISGEWLAYYQRDIPEKAWVYIRTKTSELEDKVVKIKKMTDEQLAAQLMRLHPDVYSVLPYGSAFKLLNESETLENSQSAQTQISRQIKAIHLTHHELIAWFHDFKEKNYQENYSQGKSKSSHYTLALSSRPLIVSCHDSNSIHAANKLAEIRLQQQRSPVIGIFLSPVLATESHPDSVPLGWETWSTLAQLADMPVIGLGGLSPRMFEKAEQYGAISIAGIRQFLKR